MVRAIKRENKTIYICDVCGLGYVNEVTAKGCEKFCREKGACSLEITRKAVYFPRK